MAESVGDERARAHLWLARRASGGSATRSASARSPTRPSTSTHSRPPHVTRKAHILQTPGPRPLSTTPWTTAPSAPPGPTLSMWAALKSSTTPLRTAPPAPRASTSRTTPVLPPTTPPWVRAPTARQAATRAPDPPPAPAATGGVLHPLPGPPPVPLASPGRTRPHPHQLRA